MVLLLPTYTQIERHEYEVLSLPILFENDNTRIFAVLSYNHEDFYKFSWASDIVNPNLFVGGRACCIGIDLCFAIVDLKTTEVRLNLKLDSFYCEIRVHNDKLYVVSQLEIIRIDVGSFAKEKSYYIPDIYDNMIFSDDSIIVITLDGAEYQFQI